MRTSLAEIETLEQWLLKTGDPRDMLVTEAKIIINKDLDEKAQWQSKTYDLVAEFGREKLQDEVKAIEQQLFYSRKHHTFQQRIKAIFNL